MVINIRLLIQGIIIYVLFIVGISIISEWLVPKKHSNIEKFENDLDNILEVYKNDIKKSYMDRIKYSYGNIGHQQGPYIGHQRDSHRESFTNIVQSNPYSPYNQNLQTIEEDNIMKQVSKRLIDSSNYHSTTVGPLQGNALLQGNAPLQDISNNYRIIPRKMDFHEPERMIIKPHSEYVIDNYIFNGPKKQVQFDLPEDSKYSPENYNISSIENYDINYKLF